LWVDWLIDFFEEREKAMCQKSVDCKKCDRKKQHQGGLRGGRQKDCANPEERGVRIYFVNPACAWQSSNKFGFALAWSGFLPAGGYPAELPVMNYQVKPDRLKYF